MCKIIYSINKRDRISDESGCAIGTEWVLNDHWVFSTIGEALDFAREKFP